MSGYTPLVRVTGIPSPATCDSKGTDALLVAFSRP
jgi:hypothetical protein